MKDFLSGENQRQAFPELESEIVALARYLSDEIPPMLATDAIDRLLDVPQAVATAIHAWVSTQYASPQRLSIPDYLFHAAKKLHLLVDLELLDKDRLGKLLVSLYPMLLEICPETDRAALADDLGAIGHGQGLTTSAVGVVHRPAGPRAAAGGEHTGARTAAGMTSHTAPAPDQQPEVASSLARGLERLNVLLERFSGPAGDSHESVRVQDQKQAVLTEILGELAASSESEAQLRSQMELVKEIGIGGSGSELLQLLSRSLPDWVQPTGGEFEPTPIKTMKRIVGLASTTGETQQRFFEFVNVAVRELNLGALGRAATLFRSAEEMIRSGEVDASSARIVKSQIFSRVDQEVLRKQLESEDNFRVLNHVVAFFPQVSIEELLLELEVEQSRDLREFIVNMLRAHGPTARTAALKRLSDSKAGQRKLTWNVERDLLNLVHSIHRPEDQEVDALEHEVLAHFSRIEGELAVIRETVRLLGETPGSKPESLSITRVGEIEQALLGAREVKHDPEDLRTVLDQLVRDLARRASPTAWRCVVTHSLKRTPALGDTRKRIVELGGHNLANDPAVYKPIVECLRSEVPLKLFTVTVAGKRRIDDVRRLVTALSSTDVPQVRTLFRDIADRFRGKDLATTAERALRRLSSDSDPGDMGEALPTLAGDIALFGLPNLLQNLSDSNLTGELTIQCESEDGIASVGLVDGQLSAATFRNLAGETALYQLLERPVKGQFSFVTRRPHEGSEQTGLVSVLLEGMRRYDEFTRAAAFVPDDTRLAATGVKPTLPSPEIDRNLARAIWQKASKGVAALDCERDVDVDCYQVRTLLSYWLEEGALRPVAETDDQA